MLPISKTKPDSMKAGRKPETMATCPATNWLRVTVEISSPIASAPIRKMAEAPNSTSSDPRIGTPNWNTAMATDRAMAVMPRTKYGISLPASSSGRPVWVDISASMVPRSHSRATTSEVSRVPISVMLMAINPGTRKLRLRSSGLNQMRGSATTGTAMGRPRDMASCRAQANQTPSA